MTRFIIEHIYEIKISGIITRFPHNIYSIFHISIKLNSYTVFYLKCTLKNINSILFLGTESMIF